MLLVLNKIPVFSSINFNSVERETTISTALPSLSSPLTVFKSSISSLPAKRVIILDSSEIPPATPPTWKVRIVKLHDLKFFHLKIQRFPHFSSMQKLLHLLKYHSPQY